MTLIDLLVLNVGMSISVIRSGGVVALKPVMIDNASQSDDIMRQLLRDMPNALDIDTPAKRKRFEELLDQFKKEMGCHKWRGRVAKQRKADGVHRQGVIRAMHIQLLWQICGKPGPGERHCPNA